MPIWWIDRALTAIEGEYEADKTKQAQQESQQQIAQFHNRHDW